MPKTVKVEFTVEEDDGRIVIKTLEGDEAKKWQEMMGQLCLYAEAHNKNPDWASLRWQKKEVQPNANDIDQSA